MSFSDFVSGRLEAGSIIFLAFILPVVIDITIVNNNIQLRIQVQAQEETHTHCQHVFFF